MNKRKIMFVFWLVLTVIGLPPLWAWGESSINHELANRILVTRRPYLQLGTQTSIIIRWRTDVPADSRVTYGREQDNLNMIADNIVVDTEHEVALLGLKPDTKYYYSIGTTDEVLLYGDAEHFFTTPPVEGTVKPVRIWVIGDSGTADESARAVRNGYLSFTGNNHTDVWLMLGDNAYNSGTDKEYQTAVFDMYPMLLRNVALWPALGNHDAETSGVSSSDGVGPYFDMFTLPAKAEAGGYASGTEVYYSFNYGNIHFVCLNSTESDRSPNSPMLAWLEKDMSNTAQEWIIAYWHHPPYSKGRYDSDFGYPLIEMRENILPILENYGVDLVLSGHSHSYERSFLINGHYGMSETFINDMLVNSGDGCLDGNGAYYKKNKGTVYAVVGSSGKIGSGTFDHPVMFVSYDKLGSMVIDVNRNLLNARFIDINANVLDYFTIAKGSPGQGQ